MSKLTACAAVMKIIRQSIRWILGWLFYVCIICAVGAGLGVLSHVLFGLLFEASPDYGFLAAFGFLNGFKYGSVWAGGAAIVLCVIRARKEFELRKSEVGGE